VNAQAGPVDKPSPERLWWLRTLAIFQSPRAVFEALRDDSKEQVEARQEPVLALVLLAGVAAVLLAPSTGRLLDEDLVDNSLAVVAVLLFLTGGLYGAATYWIGGAALFAVWAFGLLVYGISIVERWSVLRAAVSLALMLLGIVIVTLPFLLPLSSG